MKYFVRMTTEKFCPELDAIATGVEAKLDPFSSYARLVTQGTIETARKIGIAEEKIIAWTRARVKLEVEKKKAIKTFLPRLVTIPPPSVRSEAVKDMGKMFGGYSLTRIGNRDR